MAVQPKTSTTSTAAKPVAATATPAEATSSSAGADAASSQASASPAQAPAIIAGPAANTPALPVTKPGHPVDRGPNSTATGNCNGLLYLSFYDASTFAALSPETPAEIELRTQWGTTLVTVPLEWDKNTKNFYIDTSDIDPGTLVPPVPTCDELFDEIETPCMPATQSTPMLAVHGFSDAAVVNCKPYQMVPFLTNFPTGDRSACAPVQAILSAVEESYTLSLLAQDKCVADYIRNPKSLLDDVRLQVTPAEAPKSSAGTRATPTRGGSFSATTKQGYLEISGLTPGQPYNLHLSAPAGYVCASQICPRLVNSAGGNVALHVEFQPCGEFPARSVIFVQQACPGIRAANLSLQAIGHSHCTDANGIWNVPAGVTSGVIEFQSLGKTFSPPSIELKKDSPMVFIVAVADQEVGQIGHRGRHRFHFVDERGAPYKYRHLHLRTHSGREMKVLTDGEGGFEADEGWLAWADEDEVGHAVEEFPLLILSGE